LEIFGFLASALPAIHLVAEGNPGRALIAADGGMRHLHALGLQPHVLIGDLDSIDAAERKTLERAGIRLIVHPPDKNETDLELALHFARQQGYTTLRVLAAFGGRLDQTLANLGLLAQPELAALDLRLEDGLTEAFLVSGSARIVGQPGDTVSLLPLGREASGIVTQGLRYPLRRETLYPFRTRGISNVLLSREAAVAVANGTLLCIHSRA